MDEGTGAGGLDRRLHRLSKYEVVRNGHDALDACENVRDWLEQLEAIPEIAFDGGHCVECALAELDRVRAFLWTLVRSTR
jgi:hypothetical protein